MAPMGSSSGFDGSGRSCYRAPRSVAIDRGRCGRWWPPSSAGRPFGRVERQRNTSPAAGGVRPWLVASSLDRVN